MCYVLKDKRDQKMNVLEIGQSGVKGTIKLTDTACRVQWKQVADKHNYLHIENIYIYYFIFVFVFFVSLTSCFFVIFSNLLFGLPNVFKHILMIIGFPHAPTHYIFLLLHVYISIFLSN